MIKLRLKSGLFRSELLPGVAVQMFGVVCVGQWGFGFVRNRSLPVETGSSIIDGKPDTFGRVAEEETE